MPPFPATAALLAALMAVLCAPPAAAQPVPATPLRDPSNPQAPVPAARYESAFAGSRPFADEPAASWRELNDRTGRVGGWRAYARQAREPDAPSTSGPTSPPRAKP